MMGGLREQYKIVEFQQARAALDGYYASMVSLACLMKGRANQARIDEQVQAIRTAREQLRKAVEGLGFTVTFCEEKEQVS